MKLWQYFLIIIGVFIVYSTMFKLCKKKKPLKRAFLTMIIGLLSLNAVNISGIFTGVYLPISALSVSVSTVLGVPGVASMLIIGNLL